MNPHISSRGHYSGGKKKTGGTSDAKKTSWVVQVDESLECMPSDEQHYWEKRSIYRVPARIVDLNPKAYLPEAVSFGPYHHGSDVRLGPMEDHKHRVLLHFLRRYEESPGHLHRHLFESLKKVAGDLQASYDALDPEWKEDIDQFLQLMITDGCFMLEILRYEKHKFNDYAPDDPIFSDHGKLFVHPVIRRDMLLLENQLPMLVLDQLLDACKEDESINKLILNFLSRSLENVSKEKCLKNVSEEKCLHVLDVFRKSMLKEPEQHKGKKEDSEEKCLPVLDVFRKSMLKEPEQHKGKKDSEDIIRSATELREHGIRLRENETYKLNDISFASGILKLPKITVDEDTKSNFLNLIAFESTHIGAGSEVTSYIFFMDKIIDKGQDIALLHTKDIIYNGVESDDEAAKLFNSLANGLMLGPHSSLHDVIRRVRLYCKKRRHKWRANLKHTYFRNPWVISSLVAAVLLFGLTAIQTAYTVLSYNK